MKPKREIITIECLRKNTRSMVDIQIVRRGKKIIKITVGGRSYSSSKDIKEFEKCLQDTATS